MFEFIGNFIANLDFFQVWFMVSPFIILKQYLDKKAYKMVMSNLEEHVNDSWDNQYKQIIKQYGSMDNYMENFLKDYNIMRSQVAKIYERISMINREYMSKTDRLLERLEEGKADINEAIAAVKMIKRGNCTVTDDLLTYINAFLIQEEVKDVKKS